MGAPVLGASTSSSATNTDSLTFSKTVAAGSNLWLVVIATSEDNVGSPFPDQPVSTVTFDGDALTKVVADDNSTINHTEIWAMATTAKTGDVVVTWAGSNNGIAATAQDWSSADGFDAIATPSQSTGSSYTCSLTTNNDNSYVIQGVSHQQSGATLGGSSGQNDRVSLNAGAQSHGVLDILKATAGAQSMNASSAPFSGRWAVVLAELKGVSSVASLLLMQHNRNLRGGLQ